MQMAAQHFRPQGYPEKDGRYGGFTLVELLVVMLVIVVLMTLVAPLIRGVLGGRSVNDGLDSISDYLNYARTQAIAQNTYTLVGFYQVKGTDDLQIGSVASTNGTFDANQFATSPSSSDKPTYRPLGKIVHVPNITLVAETELSSSFKTRLNSAQVEAGISGGSIVDCLATNPTNNASILTFLSGKTVFGKMAAGSAAFQACVIVFSPQGEALYFPQAAFPNYPGQQIAISSTLPFYAQVFLGLRASRGGRVLTNDQNSAALTLDGGSGSIKAFRL